MNMNMSEEEDSSFGKLSKLAFDVREFAGHIMYYFKDENNNDILIVSNNAEPYSTNCFIHHTPSESEGAKMNVVDALAWVNSIRRVERPEPERRA